MAKAPAKSAVSHVEEALQPHVEIPRDADPVTGEIVDAAPLSQRALATVGTPPKFKIKQQVTRPLLKHGDDQTVYIRVLSEPYYGKEIKGGKYDGVALLINVHDLMSGGTAEFQYIVNAMMFRHVDDKGKMPKVENQEDVDDVLAGLKDGTYSKAGELWENFPEGITGKCFAIHKFKKADGKRYNAFEIVEIEPAE